MYLYLLNNIHALPWIIQHLLPGTNHCHCPLPPWCLVASLLVLQPPLFWPSLNTSSVSTWVPLSRETFSTPGPRYLVNFIDSFPMSLALSLSIPASHEQFFLLPCSCTLCSPFIYCSHQLVALLFASCVCLSWQTMNSTLTAWCLNSFIYNIQFRVLGVAQHIGGKSFGLGKFHCWDFSLCVKIIVVMTSFFPSISWSHWATSTCLWGLSPPTPLYIRSQVFLCRCSIPSPIHLSCWFLPQSSVSSEPYFYSLFAFLNLDVFHCGSIQEDS